MSSTGNCPNSRRFHIMAVSIGLVNGAVSVAGGLLITECAVIRSAAHEYPELKEGKSTANLPVFSGFAQMLFIRSVRYHKPMAIGKRDIIQRLSHLQMLRAEIAIHDKCLHVLPSKT